MMKLNLNLSNSAKAVVSKSILYLGILCGVLAFSSPLLAQDVKSISEQVDKTLEQGNVGEAKKILDANYNLAQKEYELLYRYSRVNALLGDMQEKENDKEAYYYEAKRYAELALGLNSNGMMGYIRRAAANGKVALFKGVLSVRELVMQAKEDAEKAIALNNTTPQNLATAHYILGRTHLKLSETAKAKRMLVGLGWGNLDDAITNLKRAVDLRNGFVMFHLDYARALISKENYAEARTQLQNIANMRFQEYGDNQRKQEAQQLLASIQGK
jgi:hypothetical protein